MGKKKSSCLGQLFKVTLWICFWPFLVPIYIIKAMAKKPQSQTFKQSANVSRNNPASQFFSASGTESTVNVPKEINNIYERGIIMGDYNELWSKWNGVHEDPEQIKRFDKSKTAECTPLEVDKLTGVGRFSGSSGVYETNLEVCRCRDFIIRRKPCKHMYRLAIELGIITTDSVKTDSRSIKSPGSTKEQRRQAFLKSIDLIESYDIETQKMIKDLIYCHNTKREYLSDDYERYSKLISDGIATASTDYFKIIRKNTQKHTLELLEQANFAFPEGLKPTKKAKFEWCLENYETVGELVYSNCKFLEPDGILMLSIKKTYSYLLRKFEDDFIIDPDGNEACIPHGSTYTFFSSPDGTRKMKLTFPEDDITELLNKYGANRCDV